MAAVFLQVPDWTKDNAAGRKILQHHGLEVFEAPIHLEGGSIHTDGEGYVPIPPTALPLSLLSSCVCCIQSLFPS